MKRAGTPLSFLVVEDEALLAMDIGWMIEDAGHVVAAEAASLQEVEAIPSCIKPDIAFVDLQLAEGSNGIDVCAYIRRRWADAIIVFVTGNPKKLPEDYAGGHGVVSKPFSRNGLMSVLRYVTEGVLDPPPATRRPAELTASPRLLREWAA